MSDAADLHRRAKEVVLAALEREPAQRERFVAAACAGDPALLAEVWSLLEVAAEPDDGFLDHPPLALGAPPRAGNEPDAALAAGTLVAGRFEITRILGEGGMGVVYEAWDRELGQAIALKAMRPEHQEEPGRRERARREMRLARRVTHPNVCRVFEVFQHAPPAAEGEPATLLAMELLRGETLADRLAARGRLAPEEALPLLAQIAAGLDAAHRAGVVHRDFKTSNVMLVPSADGGERAVITDFGVARATRREDGGATTLTGAGEVLGTPAYMAPEQLLGRPATPASDLYALGIVAYELLSGHKPFAGSTPFSAAARRLTEDPQPLGAVLPALDRRWQQAVARCLERDPDDRFRDAADFVAALEGSRVAGPQGARARARRLAAFAAAGAVLVLGATAYLAWRLAPARDAATAAAPATRSSVAVLDLVGPAEPELAWLTSSAAERLAEELGAGGALAMVPRERVAREARVAYPLPTAAAVALRAALGADYLVTGRLERAPDDPAASTLRLDLALVDGRDGGEVAHLTELGDDAELAAVVARAAERLRAALGVEPPSPEERRAAIAKLPASSAAERPYAEGLGRLRAYDARGAREQFERAVAAEPEWALGHLALAEAWSALGYESQAREASRRAFELRAPLPRPDQLLVEARFRGWSFEWQRAIELYRALYTVFPDRVDVGLRLVSALVGAGDGAAALAAVETLRSLPPPRGEDPRIDLAEAEAAWAASDWERHLRAVRAAGAKGRRLGLAGVSAEAACEEGWALRYRGELDEAARAGELCLAQWAAAGNPGGEADALNFLATVDLDRGDLEQAARRYRESAALERRLGNLNGVAVASSNLGNALYEAGDLAGAGALYAEALDLFGQVGRREGVGMMQNALGNVALGGARLAEARDRYHAALAVGRELGAKRLEALALNNIGNVAVQTAELDQAQRSFEQSLALCRELEHTRLEAYDLYGLGEVALARDDLEEARRRHEEALALRSDAGEELALAESRLGMARVLLEEGDADAAVDAARSVRRVFAERGVAASEAAALALEARALAATRASEAATTAARAVEAAHAAGGPVAKLEAELASAIAAAILGRRDAAAEAARRVRDEAAALGLVAIELEAACLAGGSRRAPASDTATVAAVSPLERATARGLGLVARRCAAEAG